MKLGDPACREQEATPLPNPLLAINQMTAEAMLASPDADRGYTTEDLLHQTQNLLQSLSAPQHSEAEEHGAFFAADQPPGATGGLQDLSGLTATWAVAFWHLVSCRAAPRGSRHSPACAFIRDPRILSGLQKGVRQPWTCTAYTCTA